MYKCHAESSVIYNNLYLYVYVSISKLLWLQLFMYIFSYIKCICNAISHNPTSYMLKTFAFSIWSIIIIIIIYFRNLAERDEVLYIRSKLRLTTK